ncbi:patulin synthase [Physcia stellaris]|nr:patulin synthase [Physcia stellaris]
MGAYNADTEGKDAIKDLGQYASGKTFLITGASQSGLGAETALILASAKPSHIILAGRSEDKISPVIEEIKKIDSSVKATYVKLDLLDNGSVRKAAEQIKSLTKKIDVIINNAGIMAPKEYATSKDGIESQFAANHVGHFLLTGLLMEEVLAAGEGATIINVSSLGYQLAEANLDDPNFDDGKSYNGWRAYGQSKTANILFSTALGKKLGSKGIAVFAVHPGVIMESKLLANSGVTNEYFMEAYQMAVERNNGNPLPPQTTKTLGQGAATIVIGALDPSFRNSSPSLLVENQVAEAAPYATDEANAEKLWALSEKLVGQKFDI